MKISRSVGIDFFYYSAERKKTCQGEVPDGDASPSYVHSLLSVRLQCCAFWKLLLWVSTFSTRLVCCPCFTIEKDNICVVALPPQTAYGTVLYFEVAFLLILSRPQWNTLSFCGCWLSYLFVCRGPSLYSFSQKQNNLGTKLFNSQFTTAG